MRILTVVGARPQFIKAAPVSAALRTKHDEILVHTGQHYDHNMSEIFFEELGIPEPDANLGVGSGSHAVQIGGMMQLLEGSIKHFQPDAVMVYGDTNSTSAAAMTAAHMHIPLAHVEAGLRSYNRMMPEEINRVVTDHLSDILLCPTQVAVDNLKLEGITKGVYVTGDVMVDTVLRNIERAKQFSTIHTEIGLSTDEPYIVLTIHRPANADDPTNLAQILAAMGDLKLPVIFPAHPRTRKALDAMGITPPDNLKMVEPLGYLNMLYLTANAAVVITDSGGLQKEAYVLKRPTITIRPETEWVETVQSGWNTLVDPQRDQIVERVQSALAHQPAEHPAVYGDGQAAQQIVAALETLQKH